MHELYFYFILFIFLYGFSRLKFCFNTKCEQIKNFINQINHNQVHKNNSLLSCILRFPLKQNLCMTEIHVISLNILISFYL